MNPLTSLAVADEQLRSMLGTGDTPLRCSLIFTLQLLGQNRDIGGVAIQPYWMASSDTNSQAKIANAAKSAFDTRLSCLCDLCGRSPGIPP
jgi:hypothetical protein